MLVSFGAAGGSVASHLVFSAVCREAVSAESSSRVSTMIASTGEDAPAAACAQEKGRQDVKYLKMNALADCTQETDRQDVRYLNTRFQKHREA
jgi:hypothetical protein